MLAKSRSPAACLDPHQPDLCVRDERVEHSYRIASTAHAGEYRIRQSLLGFLDLPPGFLSNDTVKIAHHQRVGVRSQSRPEQVMRRVHMAYPVPHGFADGVFERAASVIHADNGGPEQSHAEDIEALPAHVFLPHVDDALKSEQRANGRGCDPVLPGARLRDNAPLPHAARHQSLPQAVVDLVRAGMQQIFPLQVNAGSAQNLREPPREVQRCRPARIRREQFRQLRRERGILARLQVGFLQFLERRHQHFRHVPTAVSTEMTACIRL
jgi:hypothetical protein